MDVALFMFYRSMESPSTSMDTLTSQMQDDSDMDVEPELPTLKQVLGEDTVRKLKPKEKKRQDVINGRFIYIVMIIGVDVELKIKKSIYQFCMRCCH